MSSRRAAAQRRQGAASLAVAIEEVDNADAQNFRMPARQEEFMTRIATLKARERPNDLPIGFLCVALQLEEEVTLNRHLATNASAPRPQQFLLT